MGDSSSQVDRRRGGRGPRSCVGTRLGNHDRSAALRLPRRGALRYVRRSGSAASGCRNRTNLAAGQHRRTALPSTTSASGRRRSSRSISPELRVSSRPAARWATTRVAARPRKRQPGMLARRRGSGRQQAQRRLMQPRRSRAVRRLAHGVWRPATPPVAQVAISASALDRRGRPESSAEQGSRRGPRARCNLADAGLCLPSLVGPAGRA